PSVSAEAAVLWDPADGRALYGLRAATALPMASLTKIMTGLLALEAGVAGERVRVSPTAAAAEGGEAGLRAGQTLPGASVLAGLLVASGNDAAVAIAEHVAGGEAAFVRRMNARAATLGLESTRYLSVSGLTDDERHRSSPLDLVRLAEVAMRDAAFARVVGRPRVRAPGLGTLVSTNELLTSYAGATGVKTGYTLLAGDCLVASARRGGRTLYAAVLDSVDANADAAALLDHGFRAFRRARPLAAGTVAARYRWADLAVGAAASAPLAATVPRGARVATRIGLRPGVSRPLRAGAELGRVDLVVDGRPRDRTPLRAVDPVPAFPPLDPPARVGAALQDALRDYARVATAGAD
ncbi:MAG: D-alanyl-D-alanine carboxypeptidase, partial [Actinobacteria bacterium]|nr:D-alanyl-D-alanine carboxypeptidase [Actinomycetota bacterium]